MVRIGNYACNFYKVGYRANDAFSAYKDMGESHNLSPKQVEILKGYASGRPFETKIITIEGGNFEYNCVVRSNDAYFVTLELVR